jgi:hypothetical protein
MRIQEGDVSVELPNNSRAVVRFVRAGSRRNSFNTYTLEVAALRGPGVVDLRGSIVSVPRRTGSQRSRARSSSEVHEAAEKRELGA